jgi:hypothetical protein
MATMTDLTTSIRLQAHRANIDRYRKLLAGRLTRVEREYIMRRIAEERAAMRCLENDEDEAWVRSASHPVAEREKSAAALPWEQRL